MENQTTHKQIAQQKNLITGVQMISVEVRDLAKARPFYADVLGLSKTTHDVNANADVFELPGSTIPLAVHQMPSSEAARKPTLTSGIVLYVEDVARAATEISRRGGRIVDPAEKTEHGDILATVADPEGNEFLLAQK